MFGIGGFELFLILLFGFLIFGPDKLPAMAKTIGKAIAKFRNAQEEMSGVLKGEMVFDKDAEDPFKNPLDALDEAAAKAKKRKKIIIGSVIAGVWKVFGYFIAGGILSGFGPALGEIAGNSFQMAVGLIVGFALFTAVRQAYPPLVRLGNLGIKAGE